jgi:hypothetical protein
VVGRQFLLVVESPVGALALDLRLKGRGYQASGSRLSTGPLVICDVADT